MLDDPEASGRIRDAVKLAVSSDIRPIRQRPLDLVTNISENRILARSRQLGEAARGRQDKTIEDEWQQPKTEPRLPSAFGGFFLSRTEVCLPKTSSALADGFTESRVPAIIVVKAAEDREAPFVRAGLAGNVCISR